MIIYYSRSNEVEDSLVKPHLKTLMEHLHLELGGYPIQLTQHKRGSDYKSQLVTDADLVVVGVTELDARNEIAKGCYTEILLAQQHEVPVVAFVTDQNTGEIFLHQIRPDMADVELMDEKCWQIGHARLDCFGDYDYTHSPGVLSGGEDSFTWKHDDTYDVRNILSSLIGMHKVKHFLGHDLKEGRGDLDDLRSFHEQAIDNYKKSFTEQIFEIQENAGKTGTPMREEPRRNMLLIRKKMRR